MKRLLSLALVGVVLLSTSCQSPYAPHIQSLNYAYASGQISEREYHRRNALKVLRQLEKA